MSLARFEKVGNFHKVMGGIAYGWALASTFKGAPYFDTGDGTFTDHIPEETVPEVAKLFMEQSRVGLDMHQGDQVADVVFAYPMIGDVAKGLGFADGDTTGLAIGWMPYDKTYLEKIADGERIGFSIGGIVQVYDIVDELGNVLETIDYNGKSAGGGRKFSFKRDPFYAGGLELAKSSGLKRRVFRTWKLGEISTVDRPMQEPALIGVVKSKGGVQYRKTRTIARAVSKIAVLSSNVDGHQHVVDTTACDASGLGRTTWETAEGSDYGHDHAWVRDPISGEITIAQNEGHTHTVEATANPAITGTTQVIVTGKGDAQNLPPGTAIDSVKTATEEHAQMDPKDTEIANLKKRLSILDGWKTMTDAHRLFTTKMGPEDRDAFVELAPTKRDEMIKSAHESDPVVYTSERTKKVYRASNQEMADLAKDADEQHLETSKAKKERDEATYSKLATSTLGNLAFKREAGKYDDAQTLIKAVYTVVTDVAQRDRIMSALKGADAIAADGANVEGVETDGAQTADPDDETTTTEPGDPVAPKQHASKNLAREALTKKVTAFATANKVHKAVAMTRLLKDDDDARVLYNKAQAHDAKYKKAARV